MSEKEKAEKIHVDFSYQECLLDVEKERSQYKNRLETAYFDVIQKKGKGKDFLGWVELPESISEEDLQPIDDVVERTIAISEVVVVVGIGGSYLGTRAVTEMLGDYFDQHHTKATPQLLYAGNHLSEDYLHDLLKVLDQKAYSIVVISKSGTTTEPAIAFRILREHCEKKYGKENAQQRILIITDKAKGALKEIATQNGYDSFVIPDDVGGRYSVLTPVGLLPIAIAGFDIRKIVAGAAQMQRYLFENQEFENNIALQYALIRYLLYLDQKKIELMVSYEPKLFYFMEWFKQLFGESEGKENKGIFPASVVFSTDLHSLGQYIQEGERHLFETVISVEKSKHHVPIPYDAENLDALNYLQKRSINEINHIAEQGTRMAHVDGKVPNLTFSIPEINETIVGELIYFFEFSCAVSGYLLGVNPFDQPGVEAYKKNMFRLLGK